MDLPPRVALAVGLICAVMGVAFVLGAVGLLPMTLEPDTPPWTAVCAGLFFVLIGAAFIIPAFAPARGPDSDPFEVTPLRVIQYFLGLGLAGLMATTLTSVAFGPGERHFSMSISPPFFSNRGPSGETQGRIMFGIGAVLCWIYLLGVGVSGARTLIRDARRRL